MHLTSLAEAGFWAYLDWLCFAGCVVGSICLARVSPGLSFDQKVHWLDRVDKALSVQFCVSNSAWGCFDSWAFPSIILTIE